MELWRERAVREGQSAGKERERVTRRTVSSFASLRAQTPSIATAPCSGMASKAGDDSTAREKPARCCGGKRVRHMARTGDARRAPTLATCVMSTPCTLSTEPMESPSHMNARSLSWSAQQSESNVRDSARRTTDRGLTCRTSRHFAASASHSALLIPGGLARVSASQRAPPCVPGCAPIRLMLTDTESASVSTRCHMPAGWYSTLPAATMSHREARTRTSLPRTWRENDRLDRRVALADPRAGGAAGRVLARERERKGAAGGRARVSTAASHSLVVFTCVHLLHMVCAAACRLELGPNTD